MKTDLLAARFYGILDTGYVSMDDWKKKCKHLLDGGADLIQIRAKKQSQSEIRELIQEVYPLFRDTETPLIINDDLELCLEFENTGLHIGQDDISPQLARKALGQGRLLGLSTHSIEQAKAAIALSETLDYFAVGPVFATNTKPDYIPVGLQLVQDVSAISENPLPFFCIGGINRKNADQVKAAGARRIVVVSDVLCDVDSSNVVRNYKKQFIS